jgi:hypothetical protein
MRSISWSCQPGMMSGGYRGMVSSWFSRYQLHSSEGCRFNYCRARHLRNPCDIENIPFRKCESKREKSGKSGLVGGSTGFGADGLLYLVCSRWRFDRPKVYHKKIALFRPAKRDKSNGEQVQIHYYNMYVARPNVSGQCRRSPLHCPTTYRDPFFRAIASKMSSTVNLSRMRCRSLE